MTKTLSLEEQTSIRQEFLANALPHLFNVEGLPAEMLVNHGRLFTFKKKERVTGSIYRETFKVISFQRNWRGEFCYRAVVVTGPYEDTFGLVAHPDAIEKFLEVK